MLQRLAVVLTAILALTSTAAQSGSESTAAPKPLRIAVAANFKPTLATIAQTFTTQTGVSTTISSASTGVLTAQLRRGAPFDLLLGADQRRPESLDADGFSLNGSYCYAKGSLVLLGASNTQVLGDKNLKIAIANPRFAPYGAAALEVITRVRGTPPDPGGLILGTNVLQTLQFYRHGAADVALVSRSLSPHKGEPVATDWHKPILQYAIINKRSAQPDSAQRFLNHLLSDDVLPVLNRNGYSRCS